MVESTTSRMDLTPIHAARAAAAAPDKQPYLSALLWSLALYPIPASQWPPHAPGDIGVDRYGRVFFHEKVCTMPLEVIAHLLTHECYHLLRKHAERAMSDPTEEEALAWNIAGDCAINPDVVHSWPTQPAERGMFPSDIECEEGLAAEEYFDAALAWLRKQIQKAKQPGQSGPPTKAGRPKGEPTPCKCGSGAGTKHPAEDLLPIMADAEAVEQAERIEVGVISTIAAIKEAIKNRGNVPGGLRRFAEEVSKPSEIPWQTVLAREVRGQLRIAGVGDFTYSRPSRREAPGGVILPAMQMYRPEITIVGDTSGSMSEVDLRESLDEITAILKTTGANVDVLWWDMVGTRATNVKSRQQAAASMTGGGGTDMGAAVLEAAKPKPSTGRPPEVIVVLTDGYTDWCDRPKGKVKVVIVVPKGAPETPSWARRIERTRGRDD